MAERSKDPPSGRLGRLLKTLKTRTPFSLTDDEIEVLVAEAPNSAPACNLLAVHHFNTGDLERARGHMLEAFALAPEPNAAKNLMVVLGRLGRFDEALAFADANASVFDPIELHDALCWTNWRIGRYEASRSHGLQALALKDRDSGPAKGERVANRDGPSSGDGVRIISFSLFGAAERYLDGALRNSIVARYLYPGWAPRFHVDDSVPDRALEALEAEGAEIERITDPELARLGTFWRFLVEDDPTVDLYLVRDCDSVINIKERAAVEDWLASGRPFHIMRDHPTHAELILAGLWGARRGRLGSMRARILGYTSAAVSSLNDSHLDQKFLRHEIWPRIKQEALVHDDWFAFGEARRYRSELGLPSDRHIGQNDSYVRSPDCAHELPEV